MSSINVLDASAILAYLQQEKGEEVVESVLDAGPAWVTTVNYCEVLSKLCEKGMPADEAARAVDELGLTLIDFDPDLARRAAFIRKQTMPIGASLGDRACLALAQRAAESRAKPTSACSVYTAEQSWGKLRWPFKLVMIRSSKGA